MPAATAGGGGSIGQDHADYVGASTGRAGLSWGCATSVTGVGSACFAPPDATTHLSIEVHDAEFTLTGAYVAFEDEQGRTLAWQTACDNEFYAIPDGTVRVFVAIEEPVESHVFCTDGPYGAVEGVIAMTYFDET